MPILLEAAKGLDFSSPVALSEPHGDVLELLEDGRELGPRAPSRCPVSTSLASEPGSRPSERLAQACPFLASVLVLPPSHLVLGDRPAVEGGSELDEIQSCLDGILDETRLTRRLPLQLLRGSLVPHPAAKILRGHRGGHVEAKIPSERSTVRRQTRPPGQVRRPGTSPGPTLAMRRQVEWGLRPFQPARRAARPGLRPIRPAGTPAASALMGDVQKPG